MSETPAGRLRVGADYIRDHFTRGTFIDDGRNVCAMDAIMKAWEDNGDHSTLAWTDDWSPIVSPIAAEAAKALAAHLVKAGVETQIRIDAYGPFEAVESWNDRKVSGGAEVAAAMRLAANEWEAGQS